MLGAKFIEILNADMLSRGMSSSDEISDGGFSPDSEGVNLTVTPGLLHYPDAIDNGDSDNVLNAIGDVIMASVPDDLGFLGDPRKVVNGAGQYIAYNGTKLEAVLRTDGTNPGEYKRGFTYMASFDGATYCSNRKNLVEWEEDAATFSVAFLDYSGVASSSGLGTAGIADTIPHPLLTYENHLYTATGEGLFRTASKGVAPTLILQLSVDSIITALGVDPGSGKMLVATSSTVNASQTLPSVNKLLWYDGSSNKVSKSVPVEDTIIGFHNHGGRVYVGYGTKLGIFTGSGIQFLRQLNISRAQAELPYQCAFASIGETLCVIEKDKILAYGDIIPGRKAFWYIYANPAVTKDITHIFDAGSGKLGFSYSNEAGNDAVFSTLDTTSVASVNDSVFVTNWFNFSRPILPKAVIMEYDGTITPANNFLRYQTETDSTHTAHSLSEKLAGTTRNQEMNGFLSERVTALKFQFSQGGGSNVGLRRAILYYDVAK